MPSNRLEQRLHKLLLQQHCNCNSDKVPVCYNEGWKLICAGSNFTHENESRYSPTKDEVLAVSWSLEHSKMFILGCSNLIGSTDQRPLLSIFSNRELSNISNPRICNLKEKTMKNHFTFQYNPGRWHRGPVACSQNPAQLAPHHPTKNKTLEKKNIQNSTNPYFNFIK